MKCRIWGRFCMHYATCMYKVNFVCLFFGYLNRNCHAHEHFTCTGTLPVPVHQYRGILRSLLSQWFPSYSLYCQLLFHFCAFLSQLSELVWNLAEEINLQLASKRFPSFGPLANSNKNDAKKSQFCPNWNWTGTIYHGSVILTSFSVVLTSAKRDANGFFKVLLLSSHLFDFMTSCPKIKVWCMRSNRTLFV